MVQLQCHLGQAEIDLEGKTDFYTEKNAKNSYDTFTKLLYEYGW